MDDAGLVPKTGESYGEYMRRVREARGLTRQAFARLAGVSPSTVARVEERKTTGTRSRGLVSRRLAGALGVPVEYLMAVTGRAPIPTPLTRVCPRCWRPGSALDRRWLEPDARYCLRCGSGLRQECVGCGEPVAVRGRFCPQCGLGYGLDDGLGMQGVVRTRPM